MIVALFDPGLQPERTELAWRRICLALGVGSLVSMRLLPEAFGNAWWILGGVVGVLVSGVLWVFARRRYRAAAAALALAGERARMPDGLLVAALALFAVVIGVVSVALILAHS